MKIIIASSTAAFVVLASSAAHANSGLPSNLSVLPVEQSVLDTIARELPEQSAIGNDFLQSEFSPNLYFSEDAMVSVSFISEGAGYRNSVGYFSYESDAFDGFTFSSIDTDSSGIISVSELNALSGVTAAEFIFPNTSALGSGGLLQAGDTTVIGGGSVSVGLDGELDFSGGTVFETGSNLGFFLSANAWNGSGINGVDNSLDPNTFYSLDFLNPEAGPLATINDDVLDARHVALLEVQETGDVILGFEDLLRYEGDNDFNDAVFIVNASPATAIADSPIVQVSAAPGPGVGVVSGFFAVLAFFGAQRRAIADC
ncbi:MAG: DUF4114 domain-containing protein [Pseudomonadota bacterium]